MNIAPCNCHSQTSRPNLNERPRYYARQLVTPDDLTLEQDYFRAKLRRHNRYLHGWGVVCGAEVVVASQKWRVIVKTGYILGPYGDEIYVDADQCVDVRKNCMSPETPEDDHDCLEAEPPAADPEAMRFVAIRYLENKTRLIRVPVGGCGCEENACEYSRLSDSFEICIIDHCPDSHTKLSSFDDTHQGQAPSCPECSADPWVVLGAFKVDDAGTVTLQECECRRHVNAFGNYWWSCVKVDAPPEPPTRKKPVPPPVPKPAPAPKPTP